MMEDIETSFIKFSITEKNDLIEYIMKLSISYDIKMHLIELIENDNYHSYLEIYNICLENDIELPPI
jgi:hypothetical protein